MAETKKLSKREKILVAATLGVALFACIQYWYRPQLQKWRETSTKIDQLQTQISANKQVLQSLTQKRSPANDDRGSNIQEILQKNSSLPSFVEELTKTAVNTAFHLQRIEMKEQKKADHLLQSNFSLVAEASFSQLGQYLEALEKSPFIVQVNSVQIFRQESDLRQLTTQLDMSTFHLPAEETR